jgi:hypothetical protein
MEQPDGFVVNKGSRKQGVQVIEIFVWSEASTKAVA